MLSVYVLCQCRVESVLCLCGVDILSAYVECQCGEKMMSEYVE